MVVVINTLKTTRLNMGKSMIENVCLIGDFPPLKILSYEYYNTLLYFATIDVWVQ